MSFWRRRKSCKSAAVTRLTKCSSDDDKGNPRSYKTSWSLVLKWIIVIPFQRLRSGQVSCSNTVDNGHKYDETDDEAWRSFRYFGLFASFCALGFGTVALSSGSWVVGKGQSQNRCRNSRIARVEFNSRPLRDAMRFANVFFTARRICNAYA